MQVTKNNGIKYLFAYLFFLCVTTGRFFLEAHYARFADPKNLIFHHHYWFLFVFVLFLINFKYFIGMEPSKSWWVAFCSPVIFLPLIYNMVFRGGGLVKFNYLSAKDFPQYIKDVVTFMVFSEKNRPIAVELIIITFSIFIFSYFISKKPVRSVFCAFSCYLSLMVFAGTVIIAPQKPEFTLFVPETSLKLQNFMSFVYFSASTIAVIVLFFKEIELFFIRKQTLILFIFSFSVIFTCFQFMLISPAVVDRIFLVFISMPGAFFITSAVFAKERYALNILLFVQVIISSGIMFHAFTGS